MNKFNILVGVVGIIATFTGYLFFNSQVNDFISVGTELPDAPALFETSLAAPITATADSFTLTSNTVRGGGTLSGYQCFTIDEGSAQAEFVCGTASSTSVTGVTRGISPSDGTSAVAALQFAHRRGASVKITDFPVIQIIRNQNNGESTFENALRYAAGVVPSGASDLADVGYVLSVVNGGSVNFDALVVAGTAGETLATSTLVYFKTSDQRWWKVDTDDTTTFQDKAVGYTRGSGTAGVSVGNGGILLKGLHTGLTGLSAGSTYYASTTGGALGTASSSLPIGVAKSTTELYFDPVMIAVPRLGYNNTWTGTNTFNGIVEGNIKNTQYLVASSTFTGATTPQPVHLSSATGTAHLADGNDTNRLAFIGFAKNSVSEGGSVAVQTSGIVSGFTGLTKGDSYYLSDTAGSIATTTGTYEVLVGIAVSTTEILIQKGSRQSVSTHTISDAGNAGQTQSLTIPTGFRMSNVSLTGVNGTAVLSAFIANSTVSSYSTTGANWTVQLVSISDISYTIQFTQAVDAPGTLSVAVLTQGEI